MTKASQLRHIISYREIHSFFTTHFHIAFTFKAGSDKLIIPFLLKYRDMSAESQDIRHQMEMVFPTWSDQRIYTRDRNGSVVSNRSCEPAGSQ
jgi:hypothetical protein